MAKDPAGFCTAPGARPATPGALTGPDLSEKKTHTRTRIIFKFTPSLVVRWKKPEEAAPEGSIYDATSA